MNSDKIASGAVTNEKLGSASVKASNADFTTYTTDPQVIGKWIDGSTIYRKVYNWGKMPINASSTKEGCFPNGASLISLKGIVRNTAGTAFHNASILFADDGKGESIWSSNNANGSITVATNSDRSAWNLWIIMEYTN